MERDRNLLRHFGLNPETLYWPTTHERYSQRLADAVESRRVIAVVGPFGSGKTTLVSETVAAIDGLTPVYVNNSDRERLKIGHVATYMIHSLSSEQPKRDAVAREIQLGRIVGEHVVNKRREVVVVIENAHRISADLLLALKDMRESVKYKGKGFLFSVLLVGQEKLRTLLERFGEVELRTHAIELDAGWLPLDERVGYLTTVYGDVVDPDVRDRLANLYTTPLALDDVVQKRLLTMREAGIDRMTSRLYPLSIREQRAGLRISQTDLVKASGVPKSTISDVENGRNTDPETVAKLQNSIDALLAARRAV